MNKKTLKSVILAILSQLLILFFIGCSGTSDFTIELCNNYYINKSNSKQVVLSKHKDIGGSVILPDYYVCEYAVANEYIFTAGVETPYSTLEDCDTSDYSAVYYVINSKTDEIIGPFVDKNAVVKKIQNIGYEEKIEWHKTD